MSPLISGNSYWMESAPGRELPALSGDVHAHVCVVGGGITGLLCAHELAEAGQDVVLVEGKRLASVVTGYTTAKLTSQHSLRYAALKEELGLEAARTYGRVNEAALARIREIAGQLGVDNAIETRDAYVYGTIEETLEPIRREAEVAAEIGLPASFTDSVPLPFPTVGAVRFTDQAQIHPRRLLLPLADALIKRGVKIFESTKVTALEHDQRWTVTTESGSVTAEHVVLATGTPIAGVGNELWERLYCHQGYAVAMPLTGEGPDGVLISHDRPMRSIRTIRDGERRLLQVGGGAFVHDSNSGATPFDDLEEWAREHFDAGPAEYRWSTQDNSTVDRVPMIGALEEPNLYIAIGFGGWGLTTAGVAAALITDLVTGAEGDPERDRIFDPTRPLPAADADLISARTSSGTDEDPGEIVATLQPGQAAVVRSAERQVAVHRTEEGALQAVSAICTHAGGVVLWDREDGRWHCPCHGSVFAPDGTVANGPAQDALPDMSAFIDAN